MSSFINIYEQALDPEFCKRCIEKFEQSDKRHQGETGHGVDKIKKNSTDITILAILTNGKMKFNIYKMSCYKA